MNSYILYVNLSSIRFTLVSSEVPKYPKCCGDHCGFSGLTLAQWIAFPEAEVLKWFQNHKFLHSTRTCEVCDSYMRLTQKGYKVAGKKYTNAAWKCKSKKCKTCISIRKGTNAPLAVIFSLIWVLLVINIPPCEVVKPLPVNKILVINFTSFLSEIACHIVKNIEAAMNETWQHCKTNLVSAAEFSQRIKNK